MKELTAQKKSLKIEELANDSGFQRIEEGFQALGSSGRWSWIWEFVGSHVGLEFMHWLVTWEYWTSYGGKSNQGHRAHWDGL